MTEYLHRAICNSITATIDEYQERGRKAFALVMEIEREGWQLFAEHRAFMFEAFAYREKDEQGKFLENRRMTASFSRDVHDKLPETSDVTIWVLSSILRAVREDNVNTGFVPNR